MIFLCFIDGAIGYEDEQSLLPLTEFKARMKDGIGANPGPKQGCRYIFGWKESISVAHFYHTA